ADGQNVAIGHVGLRGTAHPSTIAQPLSSASFGRRTHVKARNCLCSRFDWKAGQVRDGRAESLSDSSQQFRNHISNEVTVVDQSTVNGCGRPVTTRRPSFRSSKMESHGYLSGGKKAEFGGKCPETNNIVVAIPR